MKELINDELQNVSAGGDSHNIPMLEYAELRLHNHGGKCQLCGTPVQEFEPYDGPTEYCGVYYYRFLCKCSELPERQIMRYYPHYDMWLFPPSVVS